MQPVIAMKERLQLTSSCIFTRVTASRRVSWSHVVDEVVVVCLCVCVFVFPRFYGTTSMPVKCLSQKQLVQ